MALQAPSPVYLTDGSGTAQIPTGMRTYFATGIGYTAYATPTDLFTISGAAGKVIRIVQMRLLAQSTTATYTTIHWIKRSTLNTGGTATQPTGFPMDSADAAHSAVINLYTAAPTTGTVIGRQYHTSLTTLLTSAPSNFTANQIATSGSINKTITLRPDESLCCNWNGAALPSGFTAGWDITWTESNI